MKMIYPVIFTEMEDCYLIEVPDLKISTQGTDLENAVEMARDAICITIESRQGLCIEIPLPSNPTEIDVSKGTFADSGKSFLSVIDVDISMRAPNAETVEAIEEIRKMKKNHSLGETYTDVDDMMNELLK